MTAIVDGLLKEGIIELLEVPFGLPEGRVRVIVLGRAQSSLPACYLTFGKYHAGRMSTLEDFEAAQWHGEEESDIADGQ